jgi:hypothetical protein
MATSVKNLRFGKTIDEICLLMKLETLKSYPSQLMEIFDILPEVYKENTDININLPYLKDYIIIVRSVPINLMDLVASSIKNRMSSKLLYVLIRTTTSGQQI